MSDDLERMGAMKHALSKIEGSKIKAVTDGDKVYLVIQDAPEELRRLADALEQLNVTDVSAIVGYTNPSLEDGKSVPAIDTSSSSSIPKPKLSE